MAKIKEEFMTGNEAALKGALSCGVEIMYGYPITPSTEILEGWAKETVKNNKLKFLQTEDETSAGFGAIGSILAGVKAFSATAGLGHILMQDPLSMAENLRLPLVIIVMQRGGPSTGTVNYSQQEVALAAFGGNGDGLRVVYSASNAQEMYELTIKAFSTAWKYRFPTIVLGDGHIAKTKMLVKITPPINPVKSTPILKENPKQPSFLRNCYSNEAIFGEKLEKNINDWQSSKNKITEFEKYRTIDAKELIVAHGSVADAAKDAVDLLRDKRYKVGLFRPVTLNPFPGPDLKKLASKMKRIYIIESSLNQLSRIVKYETSGLKISFVEISKPAVSFTAEEIVHKILIS